MGPEGRVEGRAEKASAGPLGTHSVSLPPDLDPSPVDHPAALPDPGAQRNNNQTRFRAAAGVWWLQNLRP